MLQLFFEGMSSTWSFRTAPSASFRIDGGTISDSSGQTIAVRKGGYWNARGNVYTHIDCEGPLAVTFEGTDGSVLANTFQRASIVSGIIYGDDAYLAMLTNADEWRDYRTLKTASSIVFASV